MEFDWAQVVAGLVSVALVAAGAWVLKARGKLKEVKAVIESVEEAVKDGTVTKEELVTVWNKVKELFGGQPS